MNKPLNELIDNYRSYFKEKHNFYGYENSGYEFERNDVPLSENLIHNLIECHKISGDFLDEFGLYESLYQNKVNTNWFSFADYSGKDWYYCFDEKVKNVFLVDINNNLVCECSTNIDGFMEAMTLKLILETNHLRNKSKQYDTEILNSTYFKCLRLTESNSENLFWKMLIGV